MARAAIRVGLDPIEERARAKRELSRNLYLLKGIVLDTSESSKAELKGDGKAGRWFNPAEASRSAETG